MPLLLIVDDDPDTRSVLGGILTRHGYTVEYASNGWEALLQVDRERYDLILLDIMMPGLDGGKFLTILRNYGRRGATPVVVVTALNATEAASRISPNVAHGIIEKKGGDFYDRMVGQVELIVGEGHQLYPGDN
jgi:CheY-like chemotaxis protein